MEGTGKQTGNRNARVARRLDQVRKERSPGAEVVPKRSDQAERRRAPEGTAGNRISELTNKKNRIRESGNSQIERVGDHLFVPSLSLL
mmetsp:Transcript_16651/g.18354  ORF Transcript_16651/g.18354 Transcript_16651/m.18354 type:complete len:88 (+) Transcript_16651:221-484(+)